MIDRTRLAGAALVAGTLVATAGYLAVGALTHGAGDARYLDPLWPALNGLAIGGDVLVVLGLPAVVAVQGRKAPVLTLVGYVGTLLALVMLNVGEGVLEAFVKPYLVAHGGLPSAAPAGLAVWEGVALVGLLAGLVCLGIAVIRARAVGWWAGVLLVVSPLLAFVGLPGRWALLSDYAAFAGLLVLGLRAARGARAAAADEPEAAFAGRVPGLSS